MTEHPIPRPALVTERAAKPLPRWILWLFCAAYVLPGLLGRSPWKNGDLIAYGYMDALAQGLSSWSAPTLAGVRSVGHAIKNQSGIPFAALSVSTISSRMTEKRVMEIAALLKNEVRMVEKQLVNSI